MSVLNDPRIPVQAPKAVLESLHRIRMLERDVVAECELRGIPVPPFVVCGHYDRPPGEDSPDGPLCSSCSASRHAALEPDPHEWNDEYRPLTRPSMWGD